MHSASKMKILPNLKSTENALRQLVKEAARHFHTPKNKMWKFEKKKINIELKSRYYVYVNWMGRRRRAGGGNK